MLSEERLHTPGRAIERVNALNRETPCSEQPMHLFTVGYGGRNPQDFLALLQQHRIERIVDVRLRPDRASMGVYTKANSATKGIQRLLAEHGIAYVSLPELGNVFMGCEDWRPRYQRLLNAAGEVLTERLRALPLPVCLLCAERQASACHREVIATYLVQCGYHIDHLP